MPFIDQSFQLGESGVAAAARQGRDQMIDDHGTAAPLGLGSFARVVDDEGIEDRQAAEGCLRPAMIGQRDCLARQPFQSAVLAHVNKRVSIEAASHAQPEIAREI